MARAWDAWEGVGRREKTWGQITDLRKPPNSLDGFVPIRGTEAKHKTLRMPRLAEPSGVHVKPFNVC